MSKFRKSKKERAEIVRDYVMNGLTLREAAEKHGVTAETVRKWAGSKVRPRGTRYPVKTLESKGDPLFPGSYTNSCKRWTRKDDEFIQESVISGLTVKDVSELLGRTKASVWTRKHVLIQQGFIKDPKIRFPFPEGTTKAYHTRKVQPKSLPKEIQEPTPEPVINKKETTEKKARKSSKPVKSHMLKSADKVKIGTIRICDLAKLVKKHGVKVTVKVQKKGTEIQINK